MSLRQKLQDSIRKDGVSEMTVFKGFQERMKSMVREEVERFKDEILKEMRTMMKEKMGHEEIMKLKGDSGHTPMKGIDYMTKAEMEAMKKEITPEKGKHYFDGISPRKGIDYFDGIEGKPGRDGVLPSAEAIAKKLNMKDEIIEQETIKGLANLIRNMQRAINSKGGGGGGGVSEPFHQQFTGDGSTTSFTLTYQVAGNSKAIFGFLNGQQISLTTHFTVSGNTVSTTFTPAGQPEPATLEFVYWRR